MGWGVLRTLVIVDSYLDFDLEVLGRNVCEHVVYTEAINRVVQVQNGILVIDLGFNLALVAKWTVADRLAGAPYLMKFLLFKILTGNFQVPFHEELWRIVEMNFEVFLLAGVFSVTQHLHLLILLHWVNIELIHRVVVHPRNLLLPESCQAQLI